MNLDLSLEHLSVNFEGIPFLVYFGRFIQNSYGALVYFDGFIVVALAFQDEGHCGELVDPIVGIDFSCHCIGRRIVD